MTADDKTWLSPAAVVQLTGRIKWTAQCRVLAQMGIPFRPNALGRPLVRPEAADAAKRNGRGAAVTEPDWGAVA